MCLFQKKQSNLAVGRLRDCRFRRQNNSAVLWIFTFTLFLYIQKVFCCKNLSSNGTESAAKAREKARESKSKEEKARASKRKQEKARASKSKEGKARASKRKQEKARESKRKQEQPREAKTTPGSLKIEAQRLQNRGPGAPKLRPGGSKIELEGLLEPIVDQCFIKGRFQTPKKRPGSAQELPKEPQDRPKPSPNGAQDAAKSTLGAFFLTPNLQGFCIDF